MTANSRTYMIVLDAGSIGPAYDAVTAFITSSPLFHGWWNHLPYTFLVSTDQDANAVGDALRPLTGNARFLVIEVNPASSEGMLPRGGWDWIRLREQPEPMTPALP